jgi:hypothetical protein
MTLRERSSQSRVTESGVRTSAMRALLRILAPVLLRRLLSTEMLFVRLLHTASGACFVMSARSWDRCNIADTCSTSFTGSRTMSPFTLLPGIRHERIRCFYSMYKSQSIFYYRLPASVCSLDLSMGLLQWIL